jgi:hypothetical protein
MSDLLSFWLKWHAFDGGLAEKLTGIAGGL